MSLSHIAFGGVSHERRTLRRRTAFASGPMARPLAAQKQLRLRPTLPRIIQGWQPGAPRKVIVEQNSIGRDSKPQYCMAWPSKLQPIPQKRSAQLISHSHHSPKIHPTHPTQTAPTAPTSRHSTQSRQPSAFGAQGALHASVSWGNQTASNQPIFANPQHWKSNSMHCVREGQAMRFAMQSIAKIIFKQCWQCSKMPGSTTAAPADSNRIYPLFVTDETPGGTPHEDRPFLNYSGSLARPMLPTHCWPLALNHCIRIFAIETTQ